MAEETGIGEILGRIKQRVERRDALADAGKTPIESLEDGLARGIKGTGKFATSEIPAEKDKLQQIEARARLIREWLFLNGHTVEELTSIQTEFLVGDSEFDEEEFSEYRFAIDGDKENSITMLCDFSNENTDQELEIGLATEEGLIKVRLSSSNHFNLYIDFPDWNLGRVYFTNTEPLEDMDKEQAEIVTYQLDAAMERFKIPLE